MRVSVKEMRRVGLVGLGILGMAAGGDLQAQDQSLLYVAVQGDAQVAIVDMAELEEVARIDLQTLGFTANAKPHHVAVEADGSHWYLSLIGENRVLKFDRENRLVAQAEFEVPGMLAVHPSRDLLLVGRSMSAVSPPQRIGAITRSTMEVEEVDVFFPRPHAIAVSPDGQRVYTASLAVNQMGAVDLETLDLTLTDLEGPVHTLVQFAVSPDGSTLVGTAQLTGRLLIFDLTDPEHPALRDQVEVGRQPWHPVFGADGRTVYFGVKLDNRVVAVDVTTGEVVWSTDHPGLSAPHGAAVSPDGRFLFVSSNGPGGMAMDPEHEMHEGEEHGAMHPAETGTITVLDTSDGTVVKVLEMGTNTTGVGAASR
ncbi:MAG: YncE family protein [Gemmatimonadales bacterium]|nr:MAG: YncE family protein [Gemmatimonadales bacterium]